jgi:hypothetical protein
MGEHHFRSLFGRGIGDRIMHDGFGCDGLRFPCGDFREIHIRIELDFLTFRF